MSRSDRGTEYTAGHTADSLSEAQQNNSGVPVARYQGKLVVAKLMDRRKIKIDRKLLKEMKQVSYFRVQLKMLLSLVENYR